MHTEKYPQDSQEQSNALMNLFINFKGKYRGSLQITSRTKIDKNKQTNTFKGAGNPLPQARLDHQILNAFPTLPKTFLKPSFP